MTTIKQPTLFRNNIYSDELYHHGIKGQKWGIRRFQDENGNLTEEGRKRYAKNIERGNALIARGRTKAGTIARGLGRQALITAGAYGLGDMVNTKGIENGYKMVNRGASITLKNGIRNKLGMGNTYSKMSQYAGAAMTAIGANYMQHAKEAGIMAGGLSLATGTALNLRKTIRDYRDIKIAEIANKSNKQ